MKCPQCGHWNRASFPRCFRCGAPLPQEGNAEQTPEWKEAIDSSFKPKTYVDIDEEGNAKSTADSRDQLASEMKDLRIRKERGEEEQRRLRQADTQPYVSVATGRHFQSTTRRRVVFTETEENATHPRTNGDVRPDAIPVVSPRSIDYDDYENTLPPQTDRTAARPARSRRAGDMTMRQMKATRTFGIFRFTRLFVILLLVAAVGVGGYFFLYKPLVLNHRVAPLQERTLISASIYNDLPAHIIKIPADEGAQIYIKELHKSYIVTGGYAVIEVPDYVWYSDNEEIDVETFNVTMTPYIKSSSGEQKLMEALHFDIEIPLSPLTLISPDVTYIEANSKSKYQIQFQVEKGSAVTINGEKFDDLVSSQNGLISYNATVQPIGNNIITIECKAKYYRKNTVQLTIYREPQEITLELDPTLSASYSAETMKITGTTLNKATISVLTPYENLDISSLLTNGIFSFEAKLETIGTNTIIIQATYGKKTTTVSYDVYHVPYAKDYTPKAWPMDSYNYGDFLDNLEKRVRDTQIYVCKGTITEILSSSPQLAIMETGSGTSSRQVVLENKSSDTWVVGSTLRVYGDAFGAYNGMPRLIGRYTYPYTP